jgi:kinetochore-associated protein NSL1
MAGFSEPVVFSSQQDEEAVAGTASQASVSATPREDFRVRCTSKRAVTEMVELCGRFVQKLGDALPEEIRDLALRDVQWVRTELAACFLYPKCRAQGSERLYASPRWVIKTT